MKEWKVRYYEKANGRCPVKDYIDELDVHSKAKVVRTIELLEEFGIELSSPHVKHIVDKIWELRVSSERIFYFIYRNEEIILLHGFTKKKEKIPSREIEIAQNRYQDFNKGIRS